MSDRVQDANMNPSSAAPGTTSNSPAPHSHGVCPWYLGYLLVTPLRRFVEDPEGILRPFIQPGMTVLEPGCGMGYFSLPIARLVGPGGKAVCVDLQPRMIEALRRRARRAGLLDRIETAVCRPADLGVPQWNGRVDLGLAFHMVHELPDASRFLRQVFTALRPGGRLVIREPKGHVTPAQFDVTITAAEAVGFVRGSELSARRSLGVQLEKSA